MRLLVIGCGSIGSRRARLLMEMGHEVSAYDLYAGRCFDADPQLWVMTDRWQESASENDAVLICTPAELHAKDATLCMSCGIPVFVEKPLAVSTNHCKGLAHLVGIRKVVTMSACNMRFAYRDARPVGNFLRLVSTKPLSQWRPGAEAAYGPHGILLESAVHELDLAVSHLGRIQAIRPASEVHHDNARLLLQHEHGDSIIEVDWRESAKTERYMEWLTTSGREQSALPDMGDDMYRLEMAHFLDCVATGKQPCCTLSDAAHVLEWVLRARELEGAAA